MRAQVKELVKGAYQRAKRVLSQHEKDLHVLAKELLDKETLSGEQIKKLLNITSQARALIRPLFSSACHLQDVLTRVERASPYHMTGGMRRHGERNIKCQARILWGEGVLLGVQASGASGQAAAAS